MTASNKKNKRLCRLYKTDSLAVSHRLAAGSHVLSSSEQPFQRIRYSTRPRWIRRPITPSTSQKKSSGAVACSRSTAGATALPGWSSKRSFRLDFWRASSSSAILALIRRSSRNLLIIFCREAFLPSCFPVSFFLAAAFENN
jgi:hypothetical protein